MIRKLREATVKRDRYEGHLQLLLDAYNPARRLKTLRAASHAPNTPSRFGRKSPKAQDQPVTLHFGMVHLPQIGVRHLRSAGFRGGLFPGVVLVADIGLAAA